MFAAAAPFFLDYFLVLIFMFFMFLRFRHNSGIGFYFYVRVFWRQYRTLTLYKKIGPA